MSTSPILLAVRGSTIHRTLVVDPSAVDGAGASVARGAVDVTDVADVADVGSMGGAVGAEVDVGAVAIGAIDIAVGGQLGGGVPPSHAEIRTAKARREKQVFIFVITTLTDPYHFPHFRRIPNSVPLCCAHDLTKRRASFMNIVGAR